MPVKNFFADLLDGLTGGVSSIITSAMNQSSQKKENERNRQFQAQLQEDAQSFNAEQASINRDFQHKEAELAYDRQTDFYERYQSIGSQVRQYRDAGINPALVAGGISASSHAPSSAAPSGSAASSSSSSVGSSPLPGLVDLAKTSLDFKRTREEIQNLIASRDKTEAETQNIEKQTSWIDVLNSANVGEVTARVDSIRSSILRDDALADSTIRLECQKIKESISNVDVNSSTINLNGALVELRGSEKELNQARTLVENLNAESLQKLLPYVEVHEEARIWNLNAGSENFKATAEKMVYSANLDFLYALKESNLIDNGYYEYLTNNLRWDSVRARKDSRWYEVNAIIDNTCKLAIGTGSILNGGGTIISGQASASNANTNERRFQLDERKYNDSMNKAHNKVGF